MAKCRRSRLWSSFDFLSVESFDSAESKEQHQVFVKTLMSLMIPLKKETNLRLVPINHNIFKTKRVHFERRENPETKKVELFLPRQKLEVVTVFKSAFFKGRKYFLVHSEKGESTRIVWLRYCTTVDSKELVVKKNKKNKEARKGFFFLSHKNNYQKWKVFLIILKDQTYTDLANPAAALGFS